MRFYDDTNADRALFELRCPIGPPVPRGGHAVAFAGDHFEVTTVASEYDATGEAPLVNVRLAHHG
jgi:hypothetical protein